MEGRQGCIHQLLFVQSVSFRADMELAVASPSGAPACPLNQIVDGRRQTPDHIGADIHPGFYQLRREQDTVIRFGFFAKVTVDVFLHFRPVFREQLGIQHDKPFFVRKIFIKSDLFLLGVANQDLFFRAGLNVLPLQVRFHLQADFVRDFIGIHQENTAIERILERFAQGRRERGGHH